jgi:hypothetical protein
VEKIRFGAWRALFVLAGSLIVVGGMNHPRDPSLAEMLANPDWVWSHTVLLFGFLALLWGLVLYGRAGEPPPRTRRWLKWAVIGTALQAIEMVLHTVSVVDAEHLAAHAATPVLNVHLTMSVLFYPVFALAVIGFILATARDRSLGSPWIAWLGILGATAHGVAPILVVALPFLFDVRIEGATILFPMVMLFALWLVLTGLWPLRSPASARPVPAPAGG